MISKKEFLILLLCLQCLNMFSQTSVGDKKTMEVEVAFGKKAVFYIEDNLVTLEEFKSVLKDNPSPYYENFEKAYNGYKAGRVISTVGCILLPLGIIGDRAIWCNDPETNGHVTADYSTYETVEPRDPVYIGTIISSSVILVGLIVRASGVTQLKESVSEFNSFKLSLSPNYGLTPLNQQSVGLKLKVNF